MEGVMNFQTNLWAIFHTRRTAKILKQLLENTKQQTQQKTEMNGEEYHEKLERHNLYTLHTPSVEF